VRSAALIHHRRPGSRFLVACFRPAHQEMVDAYCRKHPALAIQTHVGRTPEIIELARACIAVSGSVSLELLYRRKPSVMLYRIRPFELKLARLFKTSRYISLVNLLADKELFPEFLTDSCEAEAISGHVLGWLENRRAYHEVRGEIAALRARVATPGACQRTAEFILNELCAVRPKEARLAG
jgi:lipid-A-disaccharide synthase